MYSYVTVGLNNYAKIKFQIDTGARCNVLPYDECQKLAASNRIDRTKASTLTAYGGTQVATLGVITLPCHSAPSTETHMLNFHVVDMPTVITPILGAHSSMQLGLVTIGDNVFILGQGNAHNNANTNPIFTEYADIFDTNTIGKLLGM